MDDEEEERAWLIERAKKQGVIPASGEWQDVMFRAPKGWFQAQGLPPVVNDPKPPEPKKLPVVTYDPRAHGADCDNCPLSCTLVVPPSHAEVKVPSAIIVGMEPGYEEQRQRAPFKGPSGKRLDKMLMRFQIDRTKLHITNAALCLPRNDDEREKAFKCCEPRLKQEIAKFPKSVPIMTMGASAFKAIYGKKLAVTLVRGFVWDWEGCDLLPTVHPAYVLRDSRQTPLLVRDMERLSQRINGTLKCIYPKSFSVPNNLGELIRLLAKFPKKVSCDIETTEDPPTVATLKCVGIGYNDSVVVVPWDPKYRNALHNFFRTRTAIGHNFIAFDSIVLDRYGVKIDKIEDSLIAHHVYASHMRQGLDHLASFYTDVDPWKITAGKRLAKSEKGVPKYNDNDDSLFRYNAQDVHIEWNVWNNMQGDLANWHDLYKHDKELAFMCKDMQVNGVKVDVARKDMLSRDIKAKEERLYKEMEDIVGYTFEPNKPVDIRYILYDMFKAPVLERTPKAQLPSTGKKILQAFAITDKPYGVFCKLLITWRTCSKMRNSYLDNLDIEPDGRVHPNWRSFGTPTGRFSARKPAIQVLKRADKRFKGEPEYRIREIYIPEEGCVFYAFDLSAVEMRIAAYLSGDVAFIKSCEEGDMHTNNARLVFGNIPELATIEKAKTIGKDFRDIAKNCGFAVNYQAVAETVWETLKGQGFHVPMRDVVAMLVKLKEAYPRYFRFVAENLETVKKTGYQVIGFLTGRRRYLICPPSPSDVSNGPIQAGAADYMNARLPIIWRRSMALKHVQTSVRVRGVKLVAQIHDAAIFETPKQLVDQMQAIVRDVLDKPQEINGRTVRFPYEEKIGNRWSEV